MEKLTAYFTENGFSVQESTQITGFFTRKELAKGDHFVREGKVSRRLAFVDRGFLQYYVLLDGEEKTTYSVGENNFVVSLLSFFREVPAQENIRAVVDASLWIIEKPALGELQRTIPAFKDFYIRLLEWQICCIDQSRLDAILLTPQQRYEKILAEEPALLHQIPLHHLASILGVTPRHLSRIRKNIR